MFGDGYFEFLIELNVECVFGNVKCVIRQGLELDDGILYEVDMIICVIGYNMVWIFYFRFIGWNGCNIKDVWFVMLKCYLGMGVFGFLNYYVMNGF